MWIDGLIQAYVYHLHDSLKAGEIDDTSGWYWSEEVGKNFGPFDAKAEAIADAHESYSHQNYEYLGAL